MSDAPSAQERYDEQIAARHGGLGGYSYGAPEPEPAPQQPPPSSFDEYAAPDPAYDPYGAGEPYYDPAEDFSEFGQPGELEWRPQDPLEQLRGMIREELGTNEEFNEYDQWREERDERAEAELAAATQVEEAENAQQGFEALHAMIAASPALKGEGAAVAREIPEFLPRVVETLSAEWESLTTAGLAQGIPREVIAERLQAHSEPYVNWAISQVQEQFGLEQIRREGAAHFRGGGR
jgi:hypothetical protein